MAGRPRLSQELAALRKAVGQSLERAGVAGGELILVACSGGPDSLALAAATGFVAPRLGIRAGAVIVDHGLQEGSAQVAAEAARQCSALGLEPVLVRRVRVTKSGGPEAAARTARYRALDAAAEELGARAVLLGHTRNDQAETVLLGLARGSGTRSLSGMAPQNGRYLRPLLGLPRAFTLAACAQLGLEPWSDPQNADPAFSRVRVRETVLPLLERELGPGVSEALARTASILREDAELLDRLAAEALAKIVPGSAAHLDRSATDHEANRLELEISALLTHPVAIRNRILMLAAGRLGGQLTRLQVGRINELLEAWKGQGALNLAGVRVERAGGKLAFSSGDSAPRHSK